MIFTPTWSPDGQTIAFLQRLEEVDDGVFDDGVFLVSALGGPPRHLRTLRRPYGLSWSPDGGTLAVTHQDTPGAPAAIHLLSITSGELRKLTSPPDGYAGDLCPQFSPDGRSLAFVRTERLFWTDIHVVSVNSGEERRLTTGNTQTNGLDWTPDGQAVVFSAWRVGGAGEFCLWRVPADGGDPQPLPFGENGGWPTASREEGRLAYVRSRPRWDIWRVGGPSAPEGERIPAPFITSTAADLHPRYSPDGGQIAFTSGRSGALEIWLCESDASQPRQLTFLDSSIAGGPTWSPDGETIAFFSVQEDRWDIFAVSVSGGPARRLTSGPGRKISASWSRDGRWVYFYSSRGGRDEIWKVAAAGGEEGHRETGSGLLFCGFVSLTHKKADLTPPYVPPHSWFERSASHGKRRPQ